MLHHGNATSHPLLFFHQREFLTKDNMAAIPLFPQLSIKLKGRHFDTKEVIEAESQAMLNTIREHDFHDAIKIGRSALNGGYARMGTT
jgi:hypothetical protein